MSVVIVNPRLPRALSLSRPQLDYLSLLAVEGTRIIAHLDFKRRPAAYLDRLGDPAFYQTIPPTVVAQFEVLGLIEEKGGDYRGRFHVLTDKGRREAGSARVRRR